MPTTLDKLKPGEIIGWVNLARDLPCETAMASTEVVCLALDNQEFLELIERYPQLQQEFKNKPAKVDQQSCRLKPPVGPSRSIISPAR